MSQVKDRHHHLLFVSVSMIANAFLYAMLARVILFITAPPYTEGMLWLGLMAQLCVWIIIRSLRSKRFSAQRFDGMGLLVGGLAGGLAISIYFAMNGKSHVIQYAVVMMGHIVAQTLLWNEVTLKGGIQKRQMHFKLGLLVGILLFNYLSNPMNPMLIKDLGVAALYMCLHIFLLGWVTSSQQIWLAYEEKGVTKAGHVVTKEVASIKHFATSRNASIQSNRMTSIIFTCCFLGMSALIVAVMSFFKFQYTQNHLVKYLVDGFGVIIKKPLQWIFDFLYPLLNGPGPGYFSKFIPNWTILSVKGVSQKETVGYIEASDYASTRAAWIFLNQLISVGILILVIGAAILLIRWQMKKIVPKMGRLSKGKDTLLDAKGWLNDVLDVLKPKLFASKEDIDLYRKRYKRLLEKSKQAGVTIEPMDTAETLFTKLKMKLPAEEKDLLLMTAVYNELRYGAVHPERYHEGMQALLSVHKKLKHT